MQRTGPIDPSPREKTAVRAMVLLLVFGCLLPVSLLCGLGNVGTYFLLRRPLLLQDPAQISAAMDRIEAEVRTLRDIRDSRPVARAFLTPAQLREKTEGELLQGYTPQMAQDEKVELVTFGVLDPQIDLRQMYLDTYSSIILGLYDPGSQTMYVVSGEGFGPNERLTYAHEYMHALQFQRFDIDQLMSTGESGEPASERAAAVQALYEGEASLVEQLYQEQTFSFSDTLDYFKQSIYLLDPSMFSIPPFIENSLYFPYTQGLDFVTSLYQSGGWAAVDAAYQKPPLSTEMILHPDKYAAYDRPRVLPAPIPPKEINGDWRQVNDNAMGEWDIRLILQTFIPTQTATEAAAGWGGDRYILWHEDSSGKTALIWHTQWDTPADAQEFEKALSDYDQARFQVPSSISGNECWRSITFVCQVHSPEGDVWWFYGPDQATVMDMINANLPVPVAAG